MGLSPLLRQTEQDNQQNNADSHLYSRHGGIASGAGHGQLEYRGIHHGQLDEVFPVLLNAALVDRLSKKLIPLRGFGFRHPVKTAGRKTSETNKTIFSSGKLTFHKSF